jgi:hypothetical protein
MHPHFPFTTEQILWTLSFAALLVLLVVLLGRDRARRFPMFTASAVLMALRLLSTQMLMNRLPRMTMMQLVIVTADISVVIGILVVVELARHAFGKAGRRAWVAGALGLMVVGAWAIRAWGVWPDWKQVAGLPPLQLMQLLAQNGSLLVDVETIAVGLLIVVLGYRFGAEWRSHTQQIIVGLSTAAIGEIAVQVIWQNIVKSVRANPAILQSMADRNRIVGLGDKLSNSNSALYIAVLIWWIVCLWIDEPWAVKAAPAEETPAAEGEATEVESESAAIAETATESDEGAPDSDADRSE